MAGCAARSQHSVLRQPAAPDSLPISLPTPHQRAAALLLSVCQAPCTAGSSNASACMDGFSLQGSFEPARRNYTRLWRQVQSGLATGTLPTKPPARRFHLHLVGRGDVSALRIPKDVAGRLATVHPNLRFPQYYDQVPYDQDPLQPEALRQSVRSLLRPSVCLHCSSSTATRCLCCWATSTTSSRR
jgi:hypothetical protein